VWTHLKKESYGKTGIGIYPDGMVETDGHVGRLLKKLDELGVTDNTIVVYTTDNGAETVSWPDGGTTPFTGEKGTTWEGGFRSPCVVRWPGVIKPGTVFNNIMSGEDWMPTFLAAAGEPTIKDKLLKGHKAGAKSFKAHLDGYNFLPFFKGEEKESPRKEIFYFDQGGNLNAVRYEDWKIHFTVLKGDITQAIREKPAWPLVINLRADPYEKAALESKMYVKWYAENTMWTFVPIQNFVGEFLKSFKAFPPERGSSLSIDDVLVTAQEQAKSAGA
ncbi:MAG: sulfatase-like hydrolase/transferase, partial [Blastocatellia bacterium]